MSFDKFSHIKSKAAFQSTILSNRSWFSFRIIQDMIVDTESKSLREVFAPQEVDSLTTPPTRRDLNAQLLAAVCSNDTSYAVQLLGQGADANQSINPDETLLIRAALNLNSCLITALLDHGASLKTSLKLIAKVHKPHFAIQNIVDRAYSDGYRISLCQELESFYNRLEPELPPSQAMFEEAIRDLDDFDREKQACLDSIRHYDSLLKCLLDCSVGQDISLEDHELNRQYDPKNSVLAHCLYGIEITGFSFVGLSLQGVPITKALLQKFKLYDFTEAIVTKEDLNCFIQTGDRKRGLAIAGRLQVLLERRGRLRTQGVYNLIPLAVAAKIGDEMALRSRLEAGVDPNEVDNEGGKSALYWAIKNGHSEIIRILHKQPCIEVDSLLASHKIKNRYDESFFAHKAQQRESKPLVSKKVNQETPEARLDRQRIEKIWGLKHRTLEEIEKKWDSLVGLNSSSLVESGFHHEKSPRVINDEHDADVTLHNRLFA